VVSALEQVKCTFCCFVDWIWTSFLERGEGSMGSQIPRFTGSNILCRVSFNQDGGDEDVTKPLPVGGVTWANAEGKDTTRVAHERHATAL
jgi:hypothetical protein